MSWKPMFRTDETENFYGNAQRFATKKEAEDSAIARYHSWMLVREWKVEESDDPVNYAVIDGRDEMINRGGEDDGLDKHTQEQGREFN